MSNFKVVAVTGLTLGALGAAGFAMAEPGGRHGSRASLDFAAIDTDGDGSATRAELEAQASARLSGADANSDGVLSRDELIAAMTPPPRSLGNPFSTGPSPERTAERADRFLALVGETEGGQVDIVVVSDRQVNRLLSRADTDRDGAISQEEADAMQARHAENRHGRRGRGRE